jgi:iron transport multicopper oxidase
MTIVARDGVDIKPVDVEYLSLPLAMRLDVIINCTNDPSMHYTIYAAPASGFLQSNAKPPNVLARAFLVYGDSTIIAPPSNPSLLINTLRPDNVMNEYSMLVPKQSPKTAAADKRIVILYNSAGRGAMGSGAGTWVVNGKSFMMPTKAPVLQAAVLSGDIDSAGLKMHSNGPVPVETYMEHLEYGKRYEVVVVGRNFQQHPWHIHGYTVDMVAAGYLNLTAIPSYVDTNTNRTVTDWSKFNIETNVALPNWNQEVTVLSRGDSFSVPPMGYTVFRFTADNIGPWMFHCHVEWYVCF